VVLDFTAAWVCSFLAPHRYQQACYQGGRITLQDVRRSREGLRDHARAPDQIASRLWHYITRLPKAEAAQPEWQTAIEALMLVVELAGPTMFARIGVMRA
jgi:hypothetical protein